MADPAFDFGSRPNKNGDDPVGLESAGAAQNLRWKSEFRSNYQESRRYC